MTAPSTTTATTTHPQAIQPATPVAELSSVTARQAGSLARMKIHTVGDLLRHLPSRYERQWAEGTIADLPMGALSSTRGTIIATRWVSGRSRAQKRGGGYRGRFEATLEDHSAKLYLAWFNSSYLRDKIHPGQTLRIQGKTQAYRDQPQMVNPTWEILDDPDQTPTAQDRLKPVYPATQSLPTAQIEAIITDTLPHVLPHVTDPLPGQLLQAHAMPSLPDAFRMAHQPADPSEHKAARRRLAFNELLLLQLGMAIKRHYSHTQLTARPLRWSPAVDGHIRERFPFQLTDAQEKVVREIADDLQNTQPMNRLLQGDVGCGKTVVALYALLLAAANRKQGALMAPTELLAEQHYLSISDMLKGSSLRIELLTAGYSTAGSSQRQLQLHRIASGKADIVIGTQALLSRSVRFKDLAVIVIDEQHRFGVEQRAALRAGPTADADDDDDPQQPSLLPPPPAASDPDETTDPSDAGSAISRLRERISSLESADPAADPDQGPDTSGANHATAPTRCPHCLVMTATPIPRTLSLTIFGDLDVSTIDHAPPGRSPIKTRVVTPQQSHDVYTYIAKRVSEGEQAYVVVPTIDESGDENADPLKSVRAHKQMLETEYFPDQPVAAVHGRLKHTARESIMTRFRKGEIRVLVATTVIEVGVDVPNATLMVVEHADRFGLAQLHQLRGRIGRGTHERASLCVFIADPTNDQSVSRMNAIASTTDGFKIAESDLLIRGMGDFFGTRQHGLPPLRVANLPQDMALLQLARRDAQKIVDTDPGLADPDHALLRKLLIQQFGDALGLIDVG